MTATKILSRYPWLCAWAIFGLGALQPVWGEDARPDPSKLLTNPDDFPIVVWVQNPSRAAEYRNIGINGYMGLWQGPKSDQLAKLKKEGMALICEQNEVALTDPNRDIIVAWMHGDEPDNAQSLGEGKGYGPPVSPKKVIEDYKKIKSRGPAIPVILNLGQGVAWDEWVGRGIRTNHPEDYPEYAKGADIVSFDIYPVTHTDPAVAGKLERVGYGMDRLKGWTDKPRWTCIECTSINNPKVKPTAHQVRAIVWISLIHGAKGLIYFCHQFEPNFIESALLADTELATEVGKINRQIRSLGRILKSRDDPDTARVEVPNAQSSPVKILCKKVDGHAYIFAVNETDQTNSAVFTLKNFTDGEVEMIDEERKIAINGGAFDDKFGPYDVRLYKIALPVSQ